MVLVDHFMGQMKIFLRKVFLIEQTCSIPIG